MIGAVKNNWSVQDVILLLQKDVDRTDQDSSTVDENWLRQLYEYVKQQQQERFCEGKELENFARLQKLLNIYIHAETVVASARSLKQWGRYEINVESIDGLAPSYSSLECLEGTLRGVVSFSAKGHKQQLGTLPDQKISDYVYYKSDIVTPGQGATRYLVHHNPGIPDERRQIAIELYSDDCYLGSVTLLCGEISSLCTQFKKPYTLEKEIVYDSNSQSSGAKINFSIQKTDLKRGYLAEKRQVASNKLKEVIGWIRRFNSETNNALSGHICAADNVSLLHAAILFQEPKLVERLMKLGANPYSQSSMGSAMALALNMSDSNYKQCSEERKALESILKILQGHFDEEGFQDSENIYPQSTGKFSSNSRHDRVIPKKQPLSQNNRSHSSAVRTPLQKANRGTSAEVISQKLHQLQL